MVVKDEPTQLNILAGMLGKADIEVSAFADAEAALAAIDPADPPDLIVATTSPLRFTCLGKTNRMVVQKGKPSCCLAFPDARPAAPDNACALQCIESPLKI